MKDFFNKHWKPIVIILGILVLVFIFRGGYQTYQAEQENPDVEETDTEDSEVEVVNSEYNESDIALMAYQDRLVSMFGKLPEGYLWDMDGTLLSQGDSSMSAEEALYAYLNGIKSLDFSSAQKFSRKSRVVQSYENYFDSTNTYTDYRDSFMRNMYKQCLLSLQIEGVESITVFAENKQVFTVNANIIDLTQKEFWEKDKETIYRNLKIYNSDQGDSTKGDIYLYDYILSYYKSEDVARRDVSFDITLQRYPDLKTGWLVSIDTDVDMACKYTDGTLVVNYIKEKYYDEGYDYLDAIDNPPEKAESEDDGQVSSAEVIVPTEVTESDEVSTGEN